MPLRFCPESKVSAGGYADLFNRGEFDQTLSGQLAVYLSGREAERLGDQSLYMSSPANRAFRLASGHTFPTSRLAVVDEDHPTPDRNGFVRLDRHL